MIVPSSHSRVVERVSAPARRPPGGSRGMRPRRPSPPGTAFTLLELLIVLAIIGILAAISLPAMKGFGQSNAIANANRQLLDDLAFARQRAIVGRTTVHVVFIPPTIDQFNVTALSSASDRTLANRLMSGPYTTYALYAERSVGDQPGRPNDRYLTSWRTLPDGIIIAQGEFADLAGAAWDNANPLDRPFQYTDGVPFPSSTGNPVRMPHLAFDAQGSLLTTNAAGIRVFQDEYIQLARGSVLSTRNPGGGIDTFDVRETPLENRIFIDGLTGRARVVQPEIQ